MAEFPSRKSSYTGEDKVVDSSDSSDEEEYVFKVCRFCLEVKRGTYDIFKDNSYYSYSKINVVMEMKFAYNITIEPDPNLPSRICQDCEKSILEASLQKLKRLDHEQHLQDSLNFFK